MVMNISNDIKSEQELDAVFSALGDPTRRAILKHLSNGQANVTELAVPFQMSQPAISKHLKVLERAGLIERKIDEQRRPAKLLAQNMVEAVEWLSEFKAFWKTSFDQLEDILATIPDDETIQKNGK